MIKSCIYKNDHYRAESEKERRRERKIERKRETDKEKELSFAGSLSQ